MRSIVLIALLVFAFGVGIGLRWGIPSVRRVELEPVPQRAFGLAPDMVEKSWELWGSRGRGSEVRKDYPRHLFNAIRSYHPDEYIVFKSLSNMHPSKLDLDPKNYIYPAFHYYVCGAALELCRVSRLIRVVPDIRFYLAHPEEMGRLYLVTRGVTLVCALGVFVVTFLIAREVRPESGLPAVLCLFSAPVVWVHAHYGTRDMLATLLVSGSFLFWVRYAATGRFRFVVFASLLLGAAMGTHYLVVVACLVVPILFGLRRDWRIWLAAPIAFAGLFVASPYTILRFGRVWTDFRSETPHLELSALLGKGARFGWALHFFELGPAMFGWLVLAAVVIGLGLLVRRMDRKRAVLLFWFLVFFVVVGLDGRSYSRYYLPMVPCAAILGGLTICRFFPSQGWLERVQVGAVLLPGLVSAASYAAAFAAPNTRDLAGEWISSRIPAGTTIGMIDYPWQYEMPPIDGSKYRLFILSVEGKGMCDFDALKRGRPEYFVVSSAQAVAGAGATADRARLWSWLAVHAPRPVRFVRRVIAYRPPEDMRYVNPDVWVFGPLEYGEPVSRAR